MSEPTPEAEPPRYARQQILRVIGEGGQERLRRSRVLVVGCGALGSHSANALARAGVGALRLVDRDLVDWSNLGRQLYREADARDRRPKVLALAEQLAATNSAVEVEARALDLDASNARACVEDVDLILDGTDNVPTRFLLNDLAWACGLPWIYAGVIETRGMLQVFAPPAGPCLRCILPELPAPGSLATCDTAGVLGPAVGLVAGWQASLALRVLVEGPAALAGRQLRLEAWELEARTARVLPDPECPVCVGRDFRALAGAHESALARLCGRDAVQVLPAARRGNIELAALVERWRPLGHVEDRGVYLRLEHADFTLTLFGDGRAIFDGLTDVGLARSLYDRLVGA